MLVLTLTVRDEADVLDANLTFHLNAGVDRILVGDNGSTDGTQDVLETYAGDGSVEWTSVPDPGFSQIDEVTRMAHEAATELRADWVINSDADEFWWPRGGSLPEVLGAIPHRFGSVRGMMRHFVPRPRRAEDFAERMTVRVSAPVTHKDHTFSPHFKTAHRASPDVRIGGGSHEVFGPGLLLLLGWYPFDILHFPLRSAEQCERKYVRWWLLSQSPRVPAPRVTEFYEAYERGEAAAFYESHVVTDEQLEAGLRDGTLATDTRLRDALRAIRAGDTVDFGDTRVDRDYLSELGALEDHNQLVRTQRRVDAFDRRLSSLETGLAARLRARLGSSRLA